LKLQTEEEFFSKLETFLRFSFIRSSFLSFFSFSSSSASKSSSSSSSSSSNKERVRALLLLLRLLVGVLLVGINIRFFLSQSLFTTLVFEEKRSVTHFFSID